MLATASFLKPQLSIRIAFKINEGGAALTAYGCLMFEELADDARLEIERALLQYCELDTFAMVLLYQGIEDLVSNHVAEFSSLW